jgi:hypothetical protein
MASSPGGQYSSVLLEIEVIRAQAALSRKRFAEAQVNAKRVLSEPDAQLEGLLIQAKYTLGLSLSPFAEGLRLCKEAVALARQADDAALLSRALLAVAETEMQAGAAGDAMANANEAEQRFSSAGQKESAWRALVIAGRASRALHDESGTQQYFGKAANLLSELRQNWGEQGFNLYLKRPDVLVHYKQLGGQTVVDQRSPITQPKETMK